MTFLCPSVNLAMVEASEIRVSLRAVATVTRAEGYVKKLG